MKVYTVQMAKHRLVKAMPGVEFLDTTVKTGIKAFAPTWTMVLSHKRGTLTDRAYTALYERRMQRSQEKLPDRWEELLQKDTVALACYCQAGAFCHRHLLTNILERLCIERGVPFERMGEIE